MKSSNHRARNTKFREFIRTEAHEKAAKEFKRVDKVRFAGYYAMPSILMAVWELQKGLRTVGSLWLAKKQDYKESKCLKRSKKEDYIRLIVAGEIQHKK